VHARECESGRALTPWLRLLILLLLLVLLVLALVLGEAGGG
jgi:hypothetical protein